MADAPDLSALVRSYTFLEDQAVPESPVPRQIAEQIEAGQAKLIQVVKELGETLTSENDGKRARAKTLTTFFVDKLSEKASLVQCATALGELTASTAFGTGEGMEVARGIFSSVSLKAHPQAIRHSVYTLLDLLMTRCRPALQRLGAEFVSGYCALVEGEKDPRNLMISFSIVRVILLEFDIAKNVEDLFDITFCYFPITFTPPPDDPYGISSDDLIVALRACLSATPLFGRLALPLFFDKMQAASEKAKRQTMQALAACFPIYGAAASGEWAGRFSEALIIEVFHASDTDMQDLALTTMRSLFSTLYPDEDASSAPATVDESVHAPPETEDSEMVPARQDEQIEGVAVQVVQNSLDEMAEPDKNNAKPAVRILTALIASSNRLARYVIATAIPPLLELFKDQDQIALRPSVLTHLATLLSSLSPPDPDSTASASAIIFPPPSLSHADGESPLEPFRDDLLSIFTSSSRALTCRLPALTGLSALIQIPTFLSRSELDFCVSSLNDVLVQPDGDEYYDAALDALVLVARLFPSQLESLTLPLLFAAFPSTPFPDPHDPAAGEPYRHALEALAALCLHPSLFEILSVRLSARLEAALASAPASDAEYASATLYAHHLLATLRAVLAEKIRKGHDDVGKYVERFVPGLWSMFVLPTVAAEAEGERCVAKDPRLLVDAGRVVNLVLQRVEVERQSAFAQAANEAFHHGKLEALLGPAAAKEAGQTPFQPLSPSAPVSQQNLVSLFSASLLALRPAVSTPAADLATFLRSLLAQSLSARSEIQLAAIVQLLGSSVNKRAQDLGKFVEQDLPAYFADNVLASAQPPSQRRAALRAWAWAAKGLIVRSDQRGYTMVERMLDLFHDAVLGRPAALMLGVIAEEADRVLSKENFAVIRLLYKQRFFTFLLPKLVGLYKESSGDSQAVYLVALSSVLQHIPKQLTLTELPKLLPLLITSLDLPDPLLRANVLESLATLVKEVPSEMEHSISGIATKVLRGLTGETSQGAGKAAVQLRLASLSFLATLPAHIPYLTLHSQKATVLRELGRAVDDARRDVRRAAVDCRSRWFLYTG
ncbi:hypothetical protein Rhopal_003362-T1 [Rhodotorula paludigena]|uniref:MMS19 nucleotide excision repair protein n=1 Tax=Rhodotorula paludigena TaxID=86838 RepID=A0AAV5GCY2_9BASI|nr:hypothetical protein Rhopal_003362-T1 [Rhodotorula paludigena]